MKKILLALLLAFAPFIASAQLIVPQGGTGFISAPTDYFVMGSSTLRLKSVSTTTAASLLTGFATGTNFWSGSLSGNISNLNTGNVGIGTTTVGSPLTIQGKISGALRLLAFGGGGTYWNIDAVNSNSNPDLFFSQGGSSKMVLNSSGNLGLDNSNPTSRLSIGSGQVELPSGSAMSPALTFIGDLNTGMYSSGADTLNFSTGGTNALTINSIGQIFPRRDLVLANLGGIFVETPGYLKARFLSTDDDAFFVLGSDIASSQAFYFGATSNTSGQGSNLFLFGYSDSNLFTPTPVMAITNTGRMGVGTKAPQTTLHVSDGGSGAIADGNAVITAEKTVAAYFQTLSTDTGGILFGDVANPQAGGILYDHASDAISMKAAGATVASADSSNFGILTSFSSADGSGHTAIATVTRYLLNSAGNLSVDWENEVLNPGIGGAGIFSWAVGSAGSYDYGFDSSRRLVGDGSQLTGVTAGPGGSNGNIQYNNSGSLGGDGNFNTDGSGNVTATSFTGNGAGLTGITAAPPHIVINGSAATVVDGDNGWLIDNSIQISLDFVNRIARNPAGTNLLQYSGSGLDIDNITSIGGNTPLNGTFPISNTLGGSVTFVSGMAISWTPAP